MDDAGNILIKRISKASVFVKEITGPDDNSLSAEVLKLSNGGLESDKPVKVGKRNTLAIAGYPLMSMRLITAI